MEDLMKISKFLKNISSPTKLYILNLLKNNPRSNSEIFEILEKKKIIQDRSTSYYALESLLKSDIIEKFYDQDQKKILYRLKLKSISLDLLQFSLKKEEL